RVVFTNALNQSVELTNRAPFVLSAIDGLGDVDANVQTQKAPYQDGSTPVDVVLNERPIPIEITILADNPQEVQRMRSLLASVFNPKWGEGTLRYENDYAIREIKAIPEHIPTFPSGEKNRGYTFQRSMIDLICPDPYWKSIDIET